MNHPLRPRWYLETYEPLRRKDLERFHAQFAIPANRESRACPACGEEDFAHDFDKEGFSFGRCRQCGCLYVNPVPTQALLGAYYDGSESMEYFHREVLIPTLPERRRIFFDRTERMLPFLPEGSEVLEIGSSVGLFIDAALARGWKPTAVEINSNLVEHLRKTYPIEVHHGFFESMEFEKTFDAIVLWEVMEHLRHPGPILEQARSILNPNGKIFLTLPNIDALEFRLMGKDHELVEAPGHLNYFSVETLRVLLLRHGFRLAHHETPGILDFVNLTNAIQNRRDPGLGDRLWMALGDLMTAAEWKQLDQLVTTAIQRNRASGNLFIVAEKIAESATVPARRSA